MNNLEKAVKASKIKRMKENQMTIKQLIEILNNIDNPHAIIDMASDEEGNSYGDISKKLEEGILKETGQKVYSLKPINTMLPEERYEESNVTEEKETFDE